jgi:hypothetical protein
MIVVLFVSYFVMDADGLDKTGANTTTTTTTTATTTGGGSSTDSIGGISLTQQIVGSFLPPLACQIAAGNFRSLPAGKGLSLVYTWLILVNQL